MPGLNQFGPLLPVKRGGPWGRLGSCAGAGVCGAGRSVSMLGRIPGRGGRDVPTDVVDHGTQIRVDDGPLALVAVCSIPWICQKIIVTMWDPGLLSQ